MIPACDQTGTPLHFHSSTTSGSACLMRARTRASISPRQSPRSLIRASINREGEVSDFFPFVVFLIFFMVVRYHPRRRPLLCICNELWRNQDTLADPFHRGHFSTGGLDACEGVLCRLNCDRHVMRIGVDDAVRVAGDRDMTFPENEVAAAEAR